MRYPLRTDLSFPSPTIVNALEIVDETGKVPSATRMVAPSAAFSIALAIVAKGASTPPPLSSEPEVLTYKSVCPHPTLVATINTANKKSSLLFIRLIFIS